MNNSIITEFPSEIIKEIKSYVYRLIDPRNGETFYIGKGVGNRVFQHLKCALKEQPIGEEDDENLKYQRIRNIQKAGLSVIHIIHRHGMNDETAIHVEAALIDAYPGTTNIAAGYQSNEIGPMNAFEIMTKYKAEVAELKHKVLMININNNAEDRSTYDAVRFSWKLDKEKAQQAEFVLAIEKGIIVGVFVAHEWQLARRQYFPGFETYSNKLIGFNGEEASDEIQKLYKHKRIPSEIKIKLTKFNF